MTYKILESQEKLSITTPYMLRNDGELLTCGEIHPYIKSSYKEETQKSLYYLFYLHPSFIEWFYVNSLNDELKQNIRKLIYLMDDRYSLGPVIQNISGEEEGKVLSNLEKLKEKIGTEKETKSIKDILDKTWYLTNQEFCRVRTSNYRYKTGGDNGEIYFRISSENFNWFELIWNVCVKFIHSIDYVTIMKDPQTFGKQFDYIKIKDLKINKLPIKDFIELDGEPLVESQVIKQPSFEHNYHYGRVWATNSSSEMAGAIMNSTIALRILYDTKHKFYIYCAADDYIHRDLLEIAWEYGMYPEFLYRWQIKEEHFEDHTYQLLYAPKDKIDSTWGAKISEDDYTDRIEYDFGVITGRNDTHNVFLNKIPLIKFLKKYEIKHTYLSGWNGYEPIIKELTEELKDEVSDNTLKKRRKYYLTHGLKNVFPIGLEESLDTNNIISLLSNTFGTTDEPQPTAMYLLPNGRFLFTTPLEPSDDCDYEIDEHRNIDDFLFHKGIIEDDRYLEDDGSLFTEKVLNCIRFNITDDYYGDYSYIQLNQKQPTSQQYTSLLKIFDYAINHGYKYISIIFDTQYGKQVRLELNNYTSDELIKKIKRFYVNGILTEKSKQENILKNTSLKEWTIEESTDFIKEINNLSFNNSEIKKFYIRAKRMILAAKQNHYKLTFVQGEGKFKIPETNKKIQFWCIKNIGLQLRIYYFVDTHTFKLGRAIKKDYDKLDKKDLEKAYFSFIKK